MGFDKGLFLARIGLDASEMADGPTKENLAKVAERMVRTFPFEQLDVALGRGIDPSSDTVFKKLVVNGRGGYCFELNQLLIDALESFGYNVTRCLGRVVLGGMPGGFTHTVSVVTFDDESKYLVDVGFGGQSLRRPIPINKLGEPHLAYPSLVRVVDDGAKYVNAGGIRLQVFDGLSWHKKGKPDVTLESSQRFWKDQYAFHPAQPVMEGDILVGNYWVSTRIDGNWFTNTRMCVSQKDANGVQTMQGTFIAKTTRTNDTDIAAVLGSVPKNLPVDFTGVPDSEPPFSKTRVQIKEEEYFETLKNEFSIDLAWDHRTGQSKPVTFNDFMTCAVDKEFSFI